MYSCTWLVRMEIPIDHLRHCAISSFQNSSQVTIADSDLKSTTLVAFDGQNITSELGPFSAIPGLRGAVPKLWVVSPEMLSLIVCCQLLSVAVTSDVSEQATLHSRNNVNNSSCDNTGISQPSILTIAAS